MNEIIGKVNINFFSLLFLTFQNQSVVSLPLLTCLAVSFWQLTNICWDKCMSTPGRKLSYSEEQCLSNCAQRFFESSQVFFVVALSLFVELHRFLRLSIAFFYSYIRLPSYRFGKADSSTKDWGKVRGDVNRSLANEIPSRGWQFKSEFSKGAFAVVPQYSCTCSFYVTVK